MASRSCTPCSACSRARPPARPTATAGSGTGPPPPCCTSGRAWPTGWPTCTTRGAHTPRCWPSWATMRPTTAGWTRRWSRTSSRWPGRCPAGSAGPPPPNWPARTPRTRSPRPADVSWSDGGEPAPARVARPAAPVPAAAIDAAAAALRSGEPCLLLLGGTALRAAGLAAASQLAQGTGARLLAETFPARLERGAGLPAIDRLAYLAEFAGPQLSGARHLILAGAQAPVSFFAYPGQPSSLVPAGCQVHVLAEPGEDVPAALAALASAAAPAARPLPQPALRPAVPDGDLTAETAAAVLGAQ